MKCYKIVGYCRLCKKRFFIEKQGFAQHYCDECYEKYVNKAHEKPKSDSKKG